MGRARMRLPIVSARIVVTLTVLVALVGWDGAVRPTGPDRHGVALAQVVAPNATAIRTPTPTRPSVVAPAFTATPTQPTFVQQVTPTRTPTPTAAGPTRTPTPTPASSGPTPTFTPTPAASGPTRTPTPTPASGPPSPAGGQTVPTPTPHPDCPPGTPQCPPPPDQPPEQPRCDFDGDRKGDLAIGVPGEDFNRGAVSVQYQKDGFLTPSVLLKPQHPWGDDVLREAQFGSALSCGDYNGDTIDDLAVSGPRVVDGGTVWILWGTLGSGLDAGNYFFFRQNGADVPGSFKKGERFGYALATGDFNRDGVDDLAIGDPFEPGPGTKYTTGTVVVMPGRKGGLKLEGLYQLWGWSVLGEIDETKSQGFGWSLAAAPLVAGGGDDLAVGAPYTGVTYPAAAPGWPHNQAAGRVYLFRDHGGLVPHQVVDEAALASAGLLNIYGVPHSDTWLGWSLATGDFNADGKVDLAIGIPGKDVTQASGAGAAVIVPGDGTALNLGAESYLVQEMAGEISEAGDRYGWALAAGNWNGGVYDDLAVGAPLENVGDPSGAPGIFDAGTVYVHYGGPGNLNGATQTIRQGSGVAPGVPQANDWFGMALASVRLGNGGEYLVIGVPGEPMGNNPDCHKAGAIQLGVSWANLGPIPDPDFLLHQDTGNPFNIADERECTGSTTPWLLYFGDPATPGKGGEFFGWSIGS